MTEQLFTLESVCVHVCFLQLPILSWLSEGEIDMHSFGPNHHSDSDTPVQCPCLASYVYIVYMLGEQR